MKKILLAFIFGLIPLFSIMAAEPVTVSFSTDTIDTSGPIFIKMANKGSVSSASIKFNILKPDSKVYQSVSGNFYSDAPSLKFHYSFDKYDLNGYYKITNVVYYNRNTGDSIVTGIDTGFYVINTTPDKIPPVIKNLSVSKNNAVPGDTVAISFDIQDSLSGIQNYNVAILNTNTYKSGSLNGVKSAKVKFNYVVGQYERLGAKSIEINLLDRKLNSVKFTNNNLSFNLTVTGTTPDTVAPIIESILSVEEKDSIYLNIYAKDNFSGIAEINCKLYNSDKKLLFSPELTKINDSLYVSNISKYSPYLVMGNYSVAARAIDKNNNVTDLEYGVAIINEKNSDNSAPTFSASFDKDTVFGDEEISLKVRVTDDLSGVQYVYCVIVNSQNYGYGFQTNINTMGVKDTTVFIKLDLPKSGTIGSWRVYYVEAQDYIGNSNQVQDLGHFVHIPKYKDLKPPAFEKLSFSSKIVNAGDTVIATVIARDTESGIQTVRIGNFGTYYYLNMVNENTYQVAIPISKYAYSEDKGEWNIYISDFTDKSISIIDTSTFTVIGKGKSDIEPPVLDSIRISPSIAKLTDAIKIKVFAHDDFPGLTSVTVGFQNEDNFILSFSPIRISKNEFEYTINPGEVVPGKFELRSFYATDSADNYLDMTSDLLKDLGYSFEVLGTKVIDKDIPKFISIKATPSKVKPGEKVEIELKATDKSSLRNVYTRLQDMDETHSTILSDWKITKSNDTFTCITTYVVPEYNYNGFQAVTGMQLIDAYSNYYYDINNRYDIFEVINGKTRPNRAPTWMIDNRSFDFRAGVVIDFTIPYYWLGDPDDDQLTCTPTLDGASLPSWVTYVPETKKFTFKPTNQNTGTHVIYLVANDPAGLKDTLTINLKVRPGSSIVNTLQNESFSIYPNPAKDYLTIQTQNIVKEVVVFDMLGKVKLQINSYKDFIDVSALKSGMYIMKVVTEKGTSTENLIIK